MTMSIAIHCIRQVRATYYQHGHSSWVDLVFESSLVTEKETITIFFKDKATAIKFADAVQQLTVPKDDVQRFPSDPEPIPPCSE